MNILKSLFSKKGGKLDAPSAEALTPKGISGEVRSRSDSMAKDFIDATIETRGILPIEGSPRKRYAIPPEDEAPFDAWKTWLESSGRVKISFSGTVEWATVYKENEKFVVRTPEGTHEMDDFFSAMIEVANYYGVKVDEDSDSKGQG